MDDVYHLIEGTERAVEIVTRFDGAVVDVRHLILSARQRRASEQTFSIGPDPRADLNVPGDGLPLARFPLVRISGDAFDVCVCRAMVGDLRRKGGDLEKIAVGDGALRLPNGVELFLQLGATSFLIREVAAPLRHPVPVQIDRPFLSSLGATAAGGALFLALIFSLPPDPHTLALDPAAQVQRFATVIVRPPLVEELIKPSGGSGTDGGSKGSGAATGPKGKAGSPTAPRRNGRLAIQGDHEGDPVLAQQFAIERAKSAGMLGVLHSEGAPWSSILGDKSALGDAAEDVLGHLTGTQVSSADGTYGTGYDGIDHGGGGHAKTIGVGPGPLGGFRDKWGHDGPGGPGGPGYGCCGPGGLPGHHPHTPELNAHIEVNGEGLDKSIIRRVIHQHQNEVRFCYEQGLAKRPDLYGRVAVGFTIAATGQVIQSSVQSSTLGERSVEQCIAGAVHRWEFPKPQGVVVVSYPFVLHVSE